MRVKKGQQLELEISDIAFGGKGIARVDGMVVFVDQAVPGDRVVARVVKKKKQYAEARVDTLIEPSMFRVEAPCEYSGVCGGCKWQFLDYGKQLEFKRRHVAESLEHIGQIKGVPVHAATPSPLVFGYRNKMEFSCSDRRWLMPAEMGEENVDVGFALGLHVPGTFHKVLDTRACWLQPEHGNRILDNVRTWIKNSGKPVYGLRSHIGFWRFVVLRHSAADDRWMVNIVTSEEDRAAVVPLAERLISEHPAVVSVVNNISSRRAGVAVGEVEVPLAGSPCIRDRIGPFTFEISANSFFQTNSRGAERLYETVKRYAGLSGKETLLDLYCGTGTIAIYLAGEARAVTGLEITQSAVSDARNNCRLNRISNCSFILGDIRESLPRVADRPDVVIIDPPRAGMHQEVVGQILDMNPQRMVYVSCNPATMARDLGLLKDDYRVLEVQPVDMFPHTYHIESVARLERRTKNR